MSPQRVMFTIGDDDDDDYDSSGSIDIKVVDIQHMLPKMVIKNSLKIIQKKILIH
jgi:hypothetical protein